MAPTEALGAYAVQPREQVHMGRRCQEAREHASEMLDPNPQLTEEDLARLRVHYARCSPCRHFLNTLQATVQALQGMPAVEPPESVKRALRKGQTPE